MFARLSYSRNLLIQNKLPISLSFSQAIRQVSVSRGDRHPYLVPDIAPSSQMSSGMY